MTPSVLPPPPPAFRACNDAMRYARFILRLYLLPKRTKSLTRPGCRTHTFSGRGV